MVHDRLCPAYDAEHPERGLEWNSWRCQCLLISTIRADEARAAADRVEALPWRNDGRTVNRNAAILAARDGRLRV